MKVFGEAEKRILSYFQRGNKVIYKEQEFTIIEADKPTCLQGEPKTDVYVLLQNDEKVEEIKISYKKENADFLENKTNAERAQQIFGANWNVIIEESTLTLKK